VGRWRSRSPEANGERLLVDGAGSLWKEFSPQLQSPGWALRVRLSDRGEEGAELEGDSRERPIPGVDDVRSVPVWNAVCPSGKKSGRMFWVIGVSAPAVVTGIIDSIFSWNPTPLQWLEKAAHVLKPKPAGLVKAWR
jgi:hypothetical protein